MSLRFSVKKFFSQKEEMSSLINFLLDVRECNVVSVS